MGVAWENQWPPPKDWQDFERRLYDLLAAEWGPAVTMHGRTGQPQHGVDNAAKVRRELAAWRRMSRGLPARSQAYKLLTKERQVARLGDDNGLLTPSC